MLFFSSFFPLTRGGLDSLTLYAPPFLFHFAGHHFFIRGADCTFKGSPFEHPDVGGEQNGLQNRDTKQYTLLFFFTERELGDGETT